MRFNIWKGYKMWRDAEEDEAILRSMAIGMNSSVDITKDMHVLVLDYDIKEIKLVVESVRELQQFWNLADGFAFRTTNGYHVFFWYDQMPYGRVKQIVEYAKYVDPMFKYISRYYDHRTIRASGKHKLGDIQFERVIGGVRTPTLDEVDVGEMKMKEHAALLKFKVEIEKDKAVLS